MVRKYRDMAERLLVLSVEFDGGFDSPCWAWLGALSADQYGRLSVRKYGRVKKLWAHRVSFVTFKEQAISEGYEVDHLCQNPWCISPDHLQSVPVVKNRRYVHERKAKPTSQRKEPEYENEVEDCCD